MFRAQHLMRRIVSPAAFAILLTLGASEARAAPVYTIRDLGTLPGTSNSVATSINNQGQVVGISYNDSDGTFRQMQGQTAAPPRFSIQEGGNAMSFLYDDGKLSQSNPNDGLALSINDHGEIAGGHYSSINNAGQYVGGYGSGIWNSSSYVDNMLVDHGSKTLLPASFTPYAINDTGLIVGGLAINGGAGISEVHPAIYQDGKLTDLLSTVYSGNSYHVDGQVVAVNNDGGQLITLSLPNGKMSSFLMSPQGLTNLTALPDGNGMIGSALNDNGHVVGNGFLYNGDTVVKLTDLLASPGGWSNLNATAINDSDWIVGQGTIDGQLHAFLMAPVDSQVPEPGALIVWGGLAAFAVRRFTRRKASHHL